MIRPHIPTWPPERVLAALLLAAVMAVVVGALLQMPDPSRHARVVVVTVEPDQTHPPRSTP